MCRHEHGVVSSLVAVYLSYLQTRVGNHSTTIRPSARLQSCQEILDNARWNNVANTVCTQESLQPHTNTHCKIYMFEAHGACMPTTCIPYGTRIHTHIHVRNRSRARRPGSSAGQPGRKPSIYRYVSHEFWMVTITLAYAQHAVQTQVGGGCVHDVQLSSLAD